MKQPDADEVAARLTGRYGMSLEARAARDERGEFVDLSPTDLPPVEAFTVRVRLGWRSVDAEFVPGNYSGELLKEMGRAAPDGRAVFRSLAMTALERGARLRMAINGTSVDPKNPGSWPGGWVDCRIVLERSPVVIESSDADGMKREVFTWGGALLGMVLALLPVEEVEDRAGDIAGLPEGAKGRVEVNRYERNPLNRAACIAGWGTTCQVCGFDFSAVYGPIGEGFIHVHHLTPVSRLGDGYVIDPVKDLLPVCPNCHAMFHRADPPYPPEVLKAIIRNAAGA